VVNTYAALLSIIADCRQHSSGVTAIPRNSLNNIATGETSVDNLIIQLKLAAEIG